MNLEAVDKIYHWIRNGGNVDLGHAERVAGAHAIKASLQQKVALEYTVEKMATTCLRDFERYGLQVPDRWASDLPSEILWWWLHIAKFVESGQVDSWFHQEDKAFPYEDWAFGATGALTLLDVGSGPRSLIGRKSAKYDVEVTSMDPLAYAYNKIYELLAVEAAPRIRFGAAEILSKVLPDQRFHMVCARNCLDHSYDVIEGINQMSGVLADKGIVLLEHWKNEAEAQNYSGLHKWNMDIQDNSLIVWNKEAEMVFDHGAHGFSLDHNFAERTKGTGVRHDFLTVVLSR